jgi:hypothetical protein
MTDRFDLFISATQQNNLIIVRMFLFAIAAVIAYPVLGWLPAWMRRPARMFYLALALVIFLATVYLSSTVA